jgi:hypothetical protein
MTERCKAKIRFGDDYGDNSSTFHCQLEEGHEGEHKEGGNMGDEEHPYPYTLKWMGDMGVETTHEDCPCSDCPHETDRENNPCPVSTGELECCDQFKCKICLAHCEGEPCK